MINIFSSLITTSLFTASPMKNKVNNTINIYNSKEINNSKNKYYSKATNYSKIKYNSKIMRRYHNIKQPGIDIQRKTR